MKKITTLVAVMLTVGMFSLSSCSREDKRDAADDVQDAQGPVDRHASRRPNCAMSCPSTSQPMMT